MGSSGIPRVRQIGSGGIPCVSWMRSSGIPRVSRMGGGGIPWISRMGSGGVPQVCGQQARGARAGHIALCVGRPLGALRPWQRGQSHSPWGKARVTACSGCSSWDFQGKVTGSANSPTDKAYLKTGVLMPALCFYCQWDTAELDVPGAPDRQPCPHAVLKMQGPRPLPDPWETDYTSLPKHSIFIVVSGVIKSPKTHASRAQLAWVWPHSNHIPALQV